MERGGRNKAVSLKRSFRDAEQHGYGLRRFAAFFHYCSVFLFEIELVYLVAPEQRRVARVGDLHLAQHLAHDDFDVFVVDLHTLQAINLLHFID